VRFVNEAVVKDADLVRARVPRETAIRTRFKSDELFRFFVPDSIFVFNREVFRRKGQIGGPPVIFPRQDHGFQLVPVAQLRTVSEEANDIVFAEKRGLYAKYVAMGGFAAALFSGLVAWKEYFPEWRGKKNIFEFAGIIPGIDQLDFSRALAGRLQRAVVAALVGQHAVRTVYNIMIHQGFGRKIVQFKA